jgi:hypothetical protein
MVVEGVTIFKRICNGFSKSNIPNVQRTMLCKTHNRQCDVSKLSAKTNVYMMPNCCTHH